MRLSLHEEAWVAVGDSGGGEKPFLSERLARCLDVAVGLNTSNCTQLYPAMRIAGSAPLTR